MSFLRSLRSSWFSTLSRKGLSSNFVTVFGFRQFFTLISLPMLLQLILLGALRTYHLSAVRKFDGSIGIHRARSVHHQRLMHPYSTQTSTSRTTKSHQPNVSPRANRPRSVTSTPLFGKKEKAITKPWKWISRPSRLWMTENRILGWIPRSGNTDTLQYSAPESNNESPAGMPGPGQRTFRRLGGRQWQLVIGEHAS